MFRPTLCAMAIAISRIGEFGACIIARIKQNKRDRSPDNSPIEDYRHDVYDVTSGSILGTSIAIFSYVRHPALPPATPCSHSVSKTTHRGNTSLPSYHQMHTNHTLQGPPNTKTRMVLRRYSLQI